VVDSAAEAVKDSAAEAVKDSAVAPVVEVTVAVSVAADWAGVPVVVDTSKDQVLLKCTSADPRLARISDPRIVRSNLQQNLPYTCK